MLADIVTLSIGMWLAVFVAMLLFTLLSLRWPLVQSIGVSACVLLLGMGLALRHQQRQQRPLARTEDSFLAVVVSEPAEKPRTVCVDLLLVKSGQRLKSYIYKEEKSQRLLPGDGLRFRSRVTSIEDLHLGTFDYGSYLRRQGFSGSCFVSSHDWQHEQGLWAQLPLVERFKLKALRWRHALLNRFAALKTGHDDTYGVLAAMTLGDKRMLSPALRQSYAEAGAAHVLALSGLHMGILYALLSLVMLPARRKAITQLLLVLTFWAFALLTGLSVSVVRSALMLSLVAVFSLRSARGSTLNLLALAAIIILAINPDALYDVGFQFSFLSVFSILLLMPVLNSFWSEDYLLHHRLVALVWQLGAVSVAAQIGVAPLLAHYFGQLPVYFIATSMVVIPAAYAVLWLSVLFLLFPLSWIGQLLLGVVDAMNGVLTSISHWPGATISGLHLSVFQVVMAYVALAALYMAVLRWQGKKTFFTT